MESVVSLLDGNIQIGQSAVRGEFKRELESRVERKTGFSSSRDSGKNICFSRDPGNSREYHLKIIFINIKNDIEIRSMN